MNKILTRLKNKVVILSTIGNIITILTLLGVIDVIKADTATKIAGLIVISLVQIGILNNPDE
jgi:uncharacterized membrane protein